MLFLEICGSFSESRRDLCSSYFYCRSNSLEKKNVICKKALFLSASCIKLNILYWELKPRAGGGREGDLYGEVVNKTRLVLAHLANCGLSGHDATPVCAVPTAPCSCFRGCRMPRGRERTSKMGKRIHWRIWCEKNVLLTMENFHGGFEGAPWVGVHSGCLEMIKSSWFQSQTGFTCNVGGHSEQGLVSLEERPSV